MLFTPEDLTQGGFPHLIMHLWQEFTDDLDRELKKRQAEGKQTLTLEQALIKAPALTFCEFASNYLKTNRPVEQFFIDENYGLRLSNNKTVAVSPGVDIRGTMQGSGAVPVTPGMPQKDHGIIQINELPVR